MRRSPPTPRGAGVVALSLVIGLASALRLDDSAQELVAPLRNGDLGEGDFARLAETLDDSDSDVEASGSKAEEKAGAQMRYDPLDSHEYNKALNGQEDEDRDGHSREKLPSSKKASCVPPDSVECFVQKHMTMIEAHAEVIYNATLPKNKEEAELESTEPLVTIHGDLGTLPPKMQMDLQHARELAKMTLAASANFTSDNATITVQMPEETSEEAPSANSTNETSPEVKYVAPNATKIHTEAKTDEKTEVASDEPSQEVKQATQEREKEEKKKGPTPEERAEKLVAP